MFKVGCKKDNFSGFPKFKRFFRKIETYGITLKFSTVKKLFAIAFTCVYLLLTVGVTKNTHYCMGRINASTLAVEAKEYTYRHRPLNKSELFIYSHLYSEALVVHLV